jgi:hypothetical protein
VFAAQGADNLVLGHRAAEAAEGALDLAEVADFLAQPHGIAIRN